MQSILIATDSHPDSDRALARAVRLAQAHGAKLTALSVMEDTDENTALILREGLVEEQIKAQAASEGLQSEVVVTSGDPVAEITHAATRARADLVVMGGHHHRKMLDALRPTTMEKILRKLTCPALLAVRPAVQDYDNILGAVDFSDASRASVMAARALAPGAELALLHAVQVPYQTAIAAPGAVGDMAQMVDPEPYIEEAKSRAKTFLAEIGAEIPISYPVGPVRQALEDAMQKHPVALIGIGAHSKAGALDVLLGSLTADLVRDPPCDLLIAPPPRAAL